MVLTRDIQKCECVLVFWSVNPACSPGVRDEYTTAIRLKKDVAPVLLDETPLMEDLRQYQWIDCRSFVEVRPVRRNKPTAGTQVETVAAELIGQIIWALGIGSAIGAKIAGVIVESGVNIISLRTMSAETRAQLVESFAQRFFDA